MLLYELCMVMVEKLGSTINPKKENKNHLCFTSQKVLLAIIIL